MKYSRFLLLPIIAIIFSNSAQELTCLRKSEIIKKVAAIETKMFRERCVVYSLTAMSIAQHVYPLIMWYQKGTDSPQHDTTKQDTIEEKISRLQKIKAFFNYLFFTQEGWTAIVQTGVGIASSIITSRICDKFIHPDTLYWYVHSHAPFTVTLSIMKKQQQSDGSKAFLCLLHNRLVRQAEAICAYQVYKYKRLDAEEKEIAQRAARAMFMIQKYWLHSIAQQLKAETIDYQTLHTMLSDYEEAIKLQLNHFSIIEGETLRDRYDVKQQIKRSSL